MITVETSSHLLDLNRPYNEQEKAKIHSSDIYTVANIYYFLLDKLSNFDEAGDEEAKKVLESQFKDVEAVYSKFGFKPEANE